MSSVLPFDVITEIIDTVGENEDTDLLKELALVSHSFLQICSKHLFATIELHDARPGCHVASSKKGFVKLLKSRPDVVKYIRKLTYIVGYNPNFDDEDDILSPILPNFLRTIPRLNCLKIAASLFVTDWSKLDSTLKSALLHLMHLPTTNHIDLSDILNFKLSGLTPSINLHRLDMSDVRCSYLSAEDGSAEIGLSEMIPKIREFHTIGSDIITAMLLSAKMQDGRPAFDFIDLRRLSIPFKHLLDEQCIRYLLQNAKLLERLHLSVGKHESLMKLHDIFLSPIIRTLKVLDLTVPLYDDSFDPLLLAGLCEELEAMAGHNMLEALSFEVRVNRHWTVDLLGSSIQNVEKVLVNPGWSALRRVSFKISITLHGASREFIVEWSQVLQSLPDKYLSHLSKLESIAFNYSTIFDY